MDVRGREHRTAAQRADPRLVEERLVPARPVVAPLLLEHLRPSSADVRIRAEDVARGVEEVHLLLGIELVDHVEEHTIGEVLDRGFWAGMTLYPITKCTPERAADMIERYAGERLLANSAGDWGPSKPTAVPDLIFEMRRRGHSESLIRKVVYDNPIAFFSQSKNFAFKPRG